MRERGRENRGCQGIGEINQGGGGWKTTELDAINKISQHMQPNPLLLFPSPITRATILNITDTNCWNGPIWQTITYLGVLKKSTPFVFLFLLNKQGKNYSYSFMMKANRRVHFYQHHLFYLWYVVRVRQPEKPPAKYMSKQAGKQETSVLNQNISS